MLGFLQEGVIIIYPVHENGTGSFQELARTNDVRFGQLSILTVNPGCSRGNHYHTRKEEWFCCIHGRCLMTMENVKDGKQRKVVLVDTNREFVKVEPYENHVVVNDGLEVCELLIIISEEYDEGDPDTLRPDEKV